MSIKSSELILNEDGSIYHLNLLPEQVAPIIITVGDPDRVKAVSNYFDHIEHSVSKREFCTHTGYYKGTRITVISTGIGTDNIDIVMNELDALFNIDFNTRTVKKNLQRLSFIRIGTSGTIRKEIALDSWLISEYAIGFDTLLRYYDCDDELNEAISDEFIRQTNWNTNKGIPYVVQCSPQLMKALHSDRMLKGFTGTNVGFYAPQDRSLRLQPADVNMTKTLVDFSYDHLKLTNLEMETSGIYGLAKLLGHRAISLNAILANRATGEFSEHPEQVVDEMINYTLDRIVENKNLIN